jgi:hypothetical protein
MCTMFNKMIVFVLMVLMVVFSLVFADGPRVLKDLKRPDMLRVDKDELYVIQGTTILVYSLKDFSLKRKFGKAGSGRGELRRVVEWPNLIRVYKDHLLVETRDKLVYFTKEGKFIKEKRRPRNSALFLPVGNHFVGKIYLHDKSANIQYMRVVICDSQLNQIKEIYRQKWFQQYRPEGFQIQLFSDYLNFEVYENKIFIEESPGGLFIEVYDSIGNKLYQVKKPYEKIKVTDADKETAIAEFRKDEKAYLMIRELGSWEKVLEVMKILFPVFKPPIRNIEINNNKLYVQTFKQRDNKDEFIVMDLKGNILKTVFLPLGTRPGVEDKIRGVKYYTIANDKLYYLKENEEKKVWELYIEGIE